MVNIANKSRFKMLKDLINAMPTLRGMNLCLDQHSCRGDPCAAFRALHSGLGPALMNVDTRPRSPLFVGIDYVYFMTVFYNVFSRLFPMLSGGVLHGHLPLPAARHPLLPGRHLTRSWEGCHLLPETRF